MRLYLFLAAALFASFEARAVSPAVPFASHSYAYAAGVVVPTNDSQAVQDAAVQNFWTTWKSRYLKAGCGTGRYYVQYTTPVAPDYEMTVSEAHGYGMLATVIMAGYETNAKTIFDGLYLYFRDHPTTTNTDLMAWQQDSSCDNINGSDSATDGDLDIAMSLLMADRQWGSCGNINYKAEALKVIAAIKANELNSTYKYFILGSWVTTGSGKYYTSTRSADFLQSHTRSYEWATGDTIWTDVRTQDYDIVDAIQTNFSPSTGLIPDFIKNPLTTPAPVDIPFLEGNTDDDYGYNACRDPWRLATDWVAYGETRARDQVKKIKDYIKTASGGATNQLKAGRTLGGTVQGNYEDMSFGAPYMVAAMTDAADQAWMNSMWSRVKGAGPQGYFPDSIKLICMIVASQNWWQPEWAPDPCAGYSTPTPVPVGSSGPPSLKHAVAAPNPQRGPRLSFSLELDAPADTIEMRLYSAAMTLVTTARLQGTYGAGWTLESVPMPSLASGIYYAAFNASKDGQRGTACPPAKLLLLP